MLAQKLRSQKFQFLQLTKNFFSARIISTEDKDVGMPALCLPFFMEARNRAANKKRKARDIFLWRNYDENQNEKRDCRT